jgi:hypothetical protein
MGVTKIRLRLLEDGRPQYKIAAEVGCSPARLSEYATGKRDIPPRFIYDFMRMWKCDVHDVVGWESDALIVGED